MTSFFHDQKTSIPLQAFPHIPELGCKAMNSIQLDQIKKGCKRSIRFYYIIEGSHEWVVDDNHYLLFPGELMVLLPHHTCCGRKASLEIGKISWVHIQIDLEDDYLVQLGNWSRLLDRERQELANIFHENDKPVIASMKKAGEILLSLNEELIGQELGFTSRINNLLDDLLILTARQQKKQLRSSRKPEGAFIKLEEALRANLSHQWTVAEMAEIVGMRATAFTEKLKKSVGYSPINYLIHVRISEAVKLLQQEDITLTDVALDLGFYSSQHFSTTFKKRTGYPPSHFRKRPSSR